MGNRRPAGAARHKYIFFRFGKRGGGAPVAFLFSQTGFALASETAAPRQAVLTEQHWERLTNRPPLTLCQLFKKLDVSAHRIPIGRDPDDELAAIIRNTGGTPTARQH